MLVRLGEGCDAERGVEVIFTSGRVGALQALRACTAPAFGQLQLGFVLLDGTLADCDWGGYSTDTVKHRRHGVSVRVVTGSDGGLPWLWAGLPGITHDLTTVRTA
jgi:hypothetical protein